MVAGGVISGRRRSFMVGGPNRQWCGYGGAVETAGDWCRVLGKDKKQSSVGVVFSVGDGDKLVVVVKRRRTVADGGGRWP